MKIIQEIIYTLYKYIYLPIYKQIYLKENKRKIARKYFNRNNITIQKQKVLQTKENRELKTQQSNTFTTRKVRNHILSFFYEFF